MLYPRIVLTPRARGEGAIDGQNVEDSAKDHLRGRGFWAMGARRRRSGSRRSTSSPMSRARAPVAFGGGSEARARRSRYVSRVLAGTRGRARVRGLLRTTLRPQRRLRAPSMRSTPSAPSPEARVGRWTPRWAGDAIQPLKRRESARKARAAARETVMAVSRRCQSARGEHVQSTSCRSGRGSASSHSTSDSRTSIRSKPSAPPPEARVGRCTVRGAGDAEQPPKRRESARKARARAAARASP